MQPTKPSRKHWPLSQWVGSPCEGVYLHQGDSSGEENVIEVVGLPDIALVGCNVLLLT